MSTTEQMLPAVQPAPLFRRFFAFGIDLIIVGLPATVVGMLLFDLLSDLGEYGRLIGVALVALYFGYFDSWPGGGRSPGKRWLGLEVVSLTGGPISPARAVVRALIVTTPILLNGITLSDNVVLSTIASLLIFGLGLSLLYLAIFNRPSRRSLHDLATAAVVVRRGAQLPAALAVWRFHWGIVAALVLLALAAPALLFRAAGTWVDLDEMQSIRQRVEMLAEVRSAGVSLQWHGQTTQAGWVESKRVVVVADLRHRPTDKTETARAVAAAIYRGSEKVIADTPVTVVLSRGFRLGITVGIWRDAFPLDARQWRPQRDT